MIAEPQHNRSLSKATFFNYTSYTIAELLKNVNNGLLSGPVFGWVFFLFV